MIRSIFIDAVYLIALINPRDQYHEKTIIAHLPTTLHGEVILEFFQHDKNNNIKGFLKLELIDIEF